MNAELKFKIDHSHKNVINLEDEDESFDSSVGSDFFNKVKTVEFENMRIP